MRTISIHAFCLAIISSLFYLGPASPAIAAELPYRQMAKKSLHCQTIKNKRRQKNCARNATAAIHATCHKLPVINRNACYRKLGNKLRSAIANELHKRKK